jgi:predicted nucleic acid-binding protein
VILVDSSVWIDHFRNIDTLATRQLGKLLPVRRVLMGDLILAEVLCGFRGDLEFHRARGLLEQLPCVDIGGKEMAALAARNYRSLRSMGISVRGTIDTIIATLCIAEDLTLLYSDRDFDPFVRYLGLRSALPPN